MMAHLQPTKSLYCLDFPASKPPTALGLPISIVSTGKRYNINALRTHDHAALRFLSLSLINPCEDIFILLMLSLSFYEIPIDSFHIIIALDHFHYRQN